MARSHAQRTVGLSGYNNAQMNLWLCRGRAPVSRPTVEVIVNRFEFTAP